MATAFPWGSKVKNLRFTVPGAEASLVCGSGATYASVYVACSCTECAGRPLRAVRNGGNILSVDAWARHARTSTDHIRVYEEDSDEVGAKFGEGTHVVGAIPKLSSHSGIRHRQPQRIALDLWMHNPRFCATRGAAEARGRQKTGRGWSRTQ
jgi:hypothetical protein